MKLAVISDIHANDVALRAALHDAVQCGVDVCASLGDIVGYGPSPVKSVHLAHDSFTVSVLGNHDAAVCGLRGISDFSDYAAETVRIQRRQLGVVERTYLKLLPLVWNEGDVAMAHGDFTAPGEFRYIDDERAAAANFAARPERIMFVGHTHQPCVWMLDEMGLVTMLPAADFKLLPNRRYIINPGTVGYPRGGAYVCSTYVIYDDEASAVYFRKVPFDMNAYSSALRTVWCRAESESQSRRARSAVLKKVMAVLGVVVLGLLALLFHGKPHDKMAEGASERKYVEVVTTNRVIQVVDKVTITNYVIEVWANGVLKSSRTLDKPPDRSDEKYALSIKKAIFGVFNDGKVVGDFVDVTEKIAALVKDGKVCVKTGVSLAGRDPALGVHKLTRIEYVLDGVSRCETLQEGVMFCVPKPFTVITSAQSLALGGAFGGDEVRIMKNPNGTYDIVHLFTEPSKTKTLVVPPDNKIVPGSVRILVVAGGGAGGSCCGGGGGAGGVVEKNGLTLPVGTSYIYVGEGGGGKETKYCGNGEDSILTIGRTTYTAIGGGAGGALVRECRIGFAGGSGGGGVHMGRGGKALQPGSTTGGLGHAGGDCPHWWTGGGGGGAADTGKDAAGYRSGGKGGESVKSEAVKKIDGGIVSSISGVPYSYAKGGGGRGHPMRNHIKNTGSGGDGAYASVGGFGGSGIIIVRYATTKTAGDSKNRNPSATFPRPDSVIRTQRIDGVEWRYFVEKGAVTIGCHGENSLNHPDLWIAAVDTNALNGVVHIPGSIGGLPVKKIGKGAFQGCANVTRFVVPEGVIHCEARSFARCAQLKAVIYPRTLEWLGEGQVYRSPNVEAIAFKGNPPKCDFARCPFRGCSYGAKIAIPYDNRAMWRNVGEMDPYFCNDGCHAMRCLIKLFKEGRVLAKRTHAGFIRATFTNAAKEFWHKEKDYKDYADKKELLRNYCDEVWKNASKDGADGEHLFMPEYYNDAAKREQPVVAYATMMYFNANEDIRFGFRFRTVSIVVVDETVACLTPMWTPGHMMRYRAWYVGNPCRFERSGWHRVTIVSSGGPGCDDYHYGGMLGGVFYKRGVEKNWHRFEATPDGKTFRVTPDDIRRAVADIEREKLQKKAGKQ